MSCEFIIGVHLDKTDTRGLPEISVLETKSVRQLGEPIAIRLVFLKNDRITEKLELEGGYLVEFEMNKGKLRK